MTAKTLRPASGRRRSGATAGLALLVLAGLAAAQQRKSFPPTDPYTKNGLRAIERAGYTSLGPFRFGDDHTTAEVVETLKGVPLIWVETPHFKIGSGLEEYALPSDRLEKERIQKELERLAERLPDVKVRTRKLDPWLRLHLFAQRLEDLHTEFLRRFHLQESEFPTVPPGEDASGPYMGEGRYLGMPSKYTVLLFQRKSDLARYSNVYQGKAFDRSYHWCFPTTGSWLYATAAEFLEGDYDTDGALACEVVGGVAQSLALGFRGTRVGLCYTVLEGIGRWFSHGIDPRYGFFGGLGKAQLGSSDEGNWGPVVFARVERHVYASTRDMLGWDEASALEWADHLVLWSRFDYLIQHEGDVAGQYLRRLKEPPAGGEELAPPELVARARSELESVTGADLDQFDTRWSEWVLQSYPRK